MVVKVIGVGFVIVVIIAMVQLSAIYYVSKSHAQLMSADLIVVFAGYDGRISAGSQLAKEGKGNRLMLTGSSIKRLKKRIEKLDTPAGLVIQDGGKSRSTVEDSYLTVQTVKDQQLESVVVVTSDYHIPRALLLLKTMMIIEGVQAKVQYFQVEEFQSVGQRWKIYHNEGVKLYGSLIELAAYSITGKLPLDSPRLSNIKKILKKHLLFEKPQHLTTKS